MTRFLLISLCFVATALAGRPIFAEDSAIQSVYLIGNSLTWDTIPSKLDRDVQWHVDCGKPLTYIHANPAAPCVKTSTLWPEALRAKQYDAISFQPHYGTTLDEDLETIEKWLSLQPKAVVVIHTGWARHADREAEWEDDDADGKLTHSIAYFRALIGELRKRHPEREFRTTGAMLLLDVVAKDSESGDGPFKDVADIYRDAVHMNVHTGRYLMHNAMRQTLGQPRRQEWTDTLTAEQQAYFDSLLDRQSKLVEALIPVAVDP